jgi:glycosyltransferase involved in cell wall biosynthesis
MKILFEHQTPFLYAHGGLQSQIEQTKLALEKTGVEVEWIRWWDDTQQGDIIHFFGRAPAHHIEFAHQKGMKYVMAELLTGQGSRTLAQLRAQKLVTRVLGAVLPDTYKAAFRWESYRIADACVALTEWEGRLMCMMFDAPAEKVHVVPNGVEEIFLNSAPRQRGPWLVCTATIVGRKRVVELAQAAILARTPVWIIGKPYGSGDPYFERFIALSKQHPEMVRYEGAIEDRAALAEVYREARGFVLLSTKESLSLSALEAAACECPLLLADLPWARYSFVDDAAYCPVTSKTSVTAQKLRAFYDDAPHRPIPRKPLAWADMAEKLKAIYENLLETRS